MPIWPLVAAGITITVAGLTYGKILRRTTGAIIFAVLGLGLALAGFYLA